MNGFCESQDRKGGYYDEETGSDMGNDLHLEVSHFEPLPNLLTTVSWKLPLKCMKKIR